MDTNRAEVAAVCVCVWGVRLREARSLDSAGARGLEHRQVPEWAWLVPGGVALRRGGPCRLTAA